MRWEHLAFLHWPIPVDVIRPHVPEELEIETFDGTAWLGVVPFVMAETRFRWLPPMPTAHRFAECNLRTYVRGRDRPGVWFFSLDAESRLAVEGARVGFGLPYFRARMSCQLQGRAVRYRSERIDRRAPAARFEASWRSVAEPNPAVKGTLEHFLVERYCLYAERRGQLVCGEIAHPPWQLSPIDLELGENDMARLVGATLLGEPASAMGAQPVDVAAWGPVKV